MSLSELLLITDEELEEINKAQEAFMIDMQIDIKSTYNVPLTIPDVAIGDSNTITMNSNLNR
jgi:hypothetical protein